MKRMLLPLVFIVLLIVPYSGDNNAIVHTNSETSENRGMDMNSLASAGGSGSDENSVLYMSRELTGIQTSVLNTYSSPANHNGSIDLSQYLISGWTLYRADLDVENITAAPEREVVGLAEPPGTNLHIYEYDAVQDYYYNQLAQGFYNLAHDGVLINFTFPYLTTSYVTSSRGTAYFLIVSDYSDPTTGLTSPDPLAASEGTWTAKTVDGENTLLNQSTTYYAFMNGTDLHNDSIVFIYPEVYWGNENNAGSFMTRRYSTEFSAWSGNLGYEAILNYTYVPWSTGDSAPVVYAAPIDVNLNGSSAPLTGSFWTFNAVSGNLTSIDFDSDQSVYINHNLTLWYEKTATTTNTWDIQNSGDIVNWNATTVVAYPSVSGTLSRYANVTVGGDWTVSGLYDSAAPSVDHGNYVDYSTHIQCSNMYDETWTLTFTGHNHVTSLAAYDIAVNSSIINFLSNIDVNDDWKRKPYDLA
jgi:hypothetical protein